MCGRISTLLSVMLLLLQVPLVVGGRTHAHASPASSDSPEALWIADTAGVRKVAAGDRRLLLSVAESGGTRSVAVDPARATAWVWTGRSLLALGFDGSRRLAVPLALPATTHADLAVHSGDGSIWIAAGHELRSVSATGQLLASRRLATPAVALAVDRTILWIATTKSVAAHDAVTGDPVRLLDLGPQPDVRGIAVTPSGALWVALRDETRLLEADGTLLRTIAGRNALAVAAAHDGGAWIADAKVLRRVGLDGTVCFQLEPFGGRGQITALAAHPADGSVWAANGASLSWIDASGSFFPPLPEDREGVGEGGQGGEGLIRDLALFADALPPEVEILAPAAGAVLSTRTPAIEVSWQDAGTGIDPASFQLRLDGSPLTASCEVREEGASCTPSLALPDGDHTLSATVRDRAGNRSAPAEVRFTIDATPPIITLIRPTPGAVVEEPELTFEGTLSEPAVLRLDGTPLPSGEDGSFVHGPVLLPEGDSSFAFTATDRAGNVGSLAVTVTYEPPAGPGLPPDPATVAPPLDGTVATRLFDAAAFLWTGRRPIQTGVVPGSLDPQRIAVLRGRVLTRDGEPLPGARVTVQGHPELGATLSREDGAFDLALNGGGVLTVRIEREGMLPAWRQVHTPWRDWVVLDDVALVPLDGEATVLTAGAGELQIARGSRVEDADGARRATLLVPAGTGAHLELPDGTTQPLATLTVRATEYTVGPRGPQAMPAPLPPASAYTYAVELSVDEALAAGADRVVFDRPVVSYVENFLGFPIGGAVPAGYYDRRLGAWIPSDDGRVVKVLGVSNGIAALDVDGFGRAADASVLASLGITDDERRALAWLYDPGQSLWRVLLPHFTPWDYNWPYRPLGPPEDATSPDPERSPESEEPEEEPCEQAGSIIECQNQTLGEELPLTGTPFSLAYRSDRVPGRKTSRVLRVPLTGATVPASLKRIVLKITVAGRLFTTSHPPLPGQVHDFTWDGRDAWGRLVQGVQPVRAELGYVYDGIYGEPVLRTPRNFGRPGLLANGGPPTREEVTLWQGFEARLGQWSAHPLGFGGWSLSAHHVYDARGIVHLGDGRRVLGAGELDRVITTLAGTATLAETRGDGGPAAQALLDYPESVFVDPAGNLYSGERTRIRRIDRATGRIATIAGQSDQGFRGDGGPAAQALLSASRGLVMDGFGNLYFADAYNHRVRRIDPAGIITTVAGTGIDGYNGDGIAATAARLSFPWDLAIDPQGNLYIADSGNHRIRKVTPSGTIETVGSTNPPREDLYTAGGVAVGPDGAIYASSTYQHVVWRIEPDGDRQVVAGNGQVDYDGFFRDGVPADQTIVSYPEDLAFDAGGNLYIASQGRLRKRDPNGILTTVSGGGRDPGDGYAFAAFPGVRGLALDGQGVLYVADPHRIRRIAPALPGFTGAEVPVAAPDGREIWIFDGRGRHLRTIDALTGALRLRFAYDSGGRLASIEDGDGLVTRIERDGAGRASALVAPFGQRTGLTYHPTGWLATLRNPAGETVRLATTDDGLLTGLADPRGNETRLAYDAAGRLARDTDAAGGFKALSRVPLDGAYRVDLSTAEGRTTSYSVETLPTEERRWSNTAPDGMTSETLFRKDGSRRRAFPDGTVVTETAGPDPRFGLQAPFTRSIQVRTPAGRTWSLTSERTATHGSPGSLPTELRETVRINDRAYTSHWNATQRRHTLTTPEGRARLLDLDAQGRPATLQIGDLAPVTFAYDPQGRLSEIVQGTGSDRRILALSYSAEGWLASLTDPLARSVGFERDGAGRVLRQTLPGGRSVDFSYDPAGNQTGLTPPGRPVHEFGYTAVNLQEQYRPPALGGEGAGRVDTTYRYDLDRKLTEVLRPDGKTVHLTHDGAGRLTALDFSRGRTTYTYDPSSGRLTGISAPGGQSLTYTYDGSLLTRTTWTGPVSGSVERTYDNNFRVVAETVNGGTPINYQYDADGLLLRAGEMTITRDPQTGLVTGTALGVVTTETASNTFGELIRQEASVRGTPVFTADYTRDALGRITRKVETVEGVTDTWDYTYDPAGRLQEVHRNGSRLSRYEYDVNGNRLRHITPAEPITATYDDQDRLLTYGDITYTYTANGDLATKTQNGQTVRYEYDELGNLVKVTLPDGITIDYVIDGQNRRVGKKVNGVLVQGWVYGDQLEPVSETRGATSTTLVYGTLQNSPDYITDGGSRHRLIPDHLGSPRLAINSETGRVREVYSNDAFGRVVYQHSDLPQSLGFAGGLYDPATKLLRFGARDFDPVTGRWTAIDPVGFRGGSSNLYVYTLNEPINSKDVNGLGERTWPFTGRVFNHSLKPIPILDIDNQDLLLLLPGAETPRTRDFDFVQIGDTWYKIGPWNFDVEPNGKPDDGFTPATPAQLKDITRTLQRFQREICPQ